MQPRLVPNWPHTGPKLAPNWPKGWAYSVHSDIQLWLLLGLQCSLRHPAVVTAGLTVFPRTSSCGYCMETILFIQDKGFLKKKNSDKPNYCLGLDLLLSSQLYFYGNKARSLENIVESMSWITETQLESLHPCLESLINLTSVHRTHVAGKRRLQQTVL